MAGQDQKARAYEWRMYMDPAQMAASYVALIQWIVNVVMFQAALDNDGVRQEIRQEAGGNEYTFGLTAETGFFRIVMIPPEEWVDQQEPLHLMFGCRDLYLIGFVHGGQWLVFDDATLNGSGYLDHPQAYRSLQFNGSYVNRHFTTVPIGAWDLYLSYDSLMHHANRPRQEIMVAVYRIIVAISEARRFPEWRSRVHLLLQNMSAQTADYHDRLFSLLFHKWENISKRARRGAARFVVWPDDDFPTFERLLQNLHGGVALSRPPANQL